MQVYGCCSASEMGDLAACVTACTDDSLTKTRRNSSTYIYILIMIRVSKIKKVTSQALYKKNIEIKERRRK